MPPKIQARQQAGALSTQPAIPPPLASTGQQSPDDFQQAGPGCDLLVRAYQARDGAVADKLKKGLSDIPWSRGRVWSAIQSALPGRVGRLNGIRGMLQAFRAHQVSDDQVAVKIGTLKPSEKDPSWLTDHLRQMHGAATQTVRTHQVLIKRAADAILMMARRDSDVLRRKREAFCVAMSRFEQSVRGSSKEVQEVAGVFVQKIGEQVKRIEAQIEDDYSQHALFDRVESIYVDAEALLAPVICDCKMRGANQVRMGEVIKALKIPSSHLSPAQIERLYEEQFAEEPLKKIHLLPAILSDRLPDDHAAQIRINALVHDLIKLTPTARSEEITQLFARLQLHQVSARTAKNVEHDLRFKLRSIWNSLSPQDLMPGSAARLQSGNLWGGLRLTIPSRDLRAMVTQHLAKKPPDRELLALEQLIRNVTDDSYEAVKASIQQDSKRAWYP